ncbi:hypothetical protein BDV06DRAFT_217914 [Aspergillus oleicola]
MFRADGVYIYIDHLAEKYRIKEPFEHHPLAVVGLLVQDDVYVLKKGVRDLYYLRGVFLACPSGWRVQQRIGWPLHQIHDDVPIFFLNLRPGKAIQRNNLFIQPVGGIFHVVPFDKQPRCTSYEQVHIRTELQSLQRLPRSQANIFTVRTYLTPLTDLRKEPEQLEALWDHVRNFPDDTAEYKCHHLWGNVFEEFCREVLGKNDPCIQADGDSGAGKEERLSEKACPASF